MALNRRDYVSIPARRPYRLVRNIRVNYIRDAKLCNPYRLAHLLHLRLAYLAGDLSPLVQDAFHDTRVVLELLVFRPHRRDEAFKVLNEYLFEPFIISAVLFINGRE